MQTESISYLFRDTFYGSVSVLDIYIFIKFGKIRRYDSFEFRVYLNRRKCKFLKSVFWKVGEILKESFRENFVIIFIF